MAISPEVEAELRASCASPAPGPMTWRVVRSQITLLLDQIAADRALREAVAKGLETTAGALTIAAIHLTKLLDNHNWHPSSQMARVKIEGARNVMKDAANALAKLRTAVPAAEHCKVCGVTGWEDGEKCYRPYCPHNAAPDPDTLRPGENDSLDTHQDTPFGAGGQESGR